MSSDSGSSNVVDLLFRTTDATRWGSGKGAPLNAGEVDTNFWTLAELIASLQANPTQPLNIDSISVSGNQMMITLSDLTTTFGPFTLPTAAFRPRGNWQANTDYLIYDLVIQPLGLYLVLQSHTSAATFDPDASNLAGNLYTLLFPYPNNFDIGFFFPGLPGTGIADGGPIFQYRAARPFFMNAGLADSVAGLGDATTDALSFSITKNGSVIGSIDFGPGDTVGGFTFTDDVQFEAGDVLGVLKPVSVDVTAANLTATFAAVKGEIETPSS